MAEIGKRSRYRGCLYGLAVGDALGAPVEFLSKKDIHQRFGKEGIRDFEPWGSFSAGSYTDDTQMSLATAIGCIRSAQMTKEQGAGDVVSVVHQEYLAWLRTQDDPSMRRAPGLTCLSALQSGRIGTFEERINDSKGCGGVMRTAAAGLAYQSGEAFQRGAEFAAITHSHPTGYLTAGFLAETIALIVRGENLEDSLDGAETELISHLDHEETLSALRLALRLAAGKQALAASIRRIGEGWIAEEALAIAVYCASKFRDDFERAVIAAVNHSGDSDSTGSITAAILGTLLGVEAIPAKWVRDVENSVRIGEIADEMFEQFGRTGRMGE